ncbi:MAG: hypothetical protein ABJ205_12110 [Erythrobacter sp.]
MQSAPSYFSLAAAAFYVLVSVTSLIAYKTAFTTNQSVSHQAAWATAALLFVLLALSRTFQAEEAARAMLRAWISSLDMRDDRRLIQGIAVSLVLPLFVLIVLYSSAFFSRFMVGRRNIAVAAALLGCSGMLLLVVLRTISLHSLDRLLFGALKLNWFGDIGAALLVAGAASYYTARVRGLT